MRERIVAARLRPSEAARRGAHRADRIIFERAGPARLAQAMPEPFEGDRAEIVTVDAERVEITVAGPPPIAELDPELEAAPGRADEFRLVDTEQRVESLDRRDRRLPYPDRADLFGFDQCDRDRVPAEYARESGGGHPAGSAAANDRDSADLMAHAALCPIILLLLKKSPACPAGSTPAGGKRISR